MKDRITIRLDEETLTDLRKAMRDTNARMSSVVRDALTHYLSIIGRRETFDFNLKETEKVFG